MSVHDSVSVVITVRNRKAATLEQQIASFREHGCDPSFIVVDYGSDPDFSREYARLCTKLSLAYHRMSTEGLPWNKCHAINRGARLAATDYIALSDLDMLYTTDPLSYCLDNYTGKTIYHIDGYWMPKSGNKKKARYAGRGNYGFFLFIRSAAFRETGGYDERIKYWGQEDLDWPARLKDLGYRQEWLPEPHKIYHQWHPRADSSVYRPAVADYATMECCAENAFDPALGQDWGKAVEPKDRPILSFIGNKEPLVVELGANEVSKFDGVRRVCLSSKEARFVELRLGARLVHRPLSAFAGPLMTLLRPATALSGLSCSYKTNRNFDFFYAILPALLKRGLLDYFISPDAESIYLLWSGDHNA